MKKHNSIISIDKRIKQISNEKYINKFFSNYEIIDKSNIISEFLLNDSKDWLKEYSNVIDKIIDLTNDSKFNQKSYEYYLLKLVLINDTIDYYDKLYKKINKKIKININYDLTFNFEILNKYLLFAFNSKSDMKDSYEKSILSKIENEANKINEFMRKINLISEAKNKKEFFKYGQDTIDLAANIRSIIRDEKSLIILIDYLYKGIYESSCDSAVSKLFTDFTNLNTKILDIIKKYRNFFDHELRNNRDKIKIVTDFNEAIIGKLFPDKESEYMNIQYNLYIEIRKLLEDVYNQLNNNK